MKILKIKEVINGNFAIKEEKGRILYDVLKENLENDEKLTLDFSDIIASTTRFFNVSLGLLYKDFPENIVDDIKIENINSIINSQLEVSKNGSKEFYGIK